MPRHRARHVPSLLNVQARPRLLTATRQNDRSHEDGHEQQSRGEAPVAHQPRMLRRIAGRRSMPYRAAVSVVQ